MKLSKKCDQCLTITRIDQMFSLIWRKKKRQLDLCPNCFADFKQRELKELEIKSKDLMKSGLWQEGARGVDIKSYLEKWTKTQKDRI